VIESAIEGSAECVAHVKQVRLVFPMQKSSVKVSVLLELDRQTYRSVVRCRVSLSSGVVLLSAHLLWDTHISVFPSVR